MIGILTTERRIASVKNTHQRVRLVATHLPENLLIELKKIESTEQTDTSTVLTKLLNKGISEWKKENAAKLYAEGKVTLELAATNADVGVREMMDYLKHGRIPSRQDIEDIEEGT